MNVSSPLVRAIVAHLAVAELAGAPSLGRATEPGRGRTAQFEMDYIRFTIDHHFAALRMTELAAGTDLQRNPELSPNEGTSPTPGFAATQAKATIDELKSMARRNNRMQREEILTLQRFLREWYGVDYQPSLRPNNKHLVAVLEQASPGAAFNHAFYEAFSRHHYTLMEPVNACMTGTELKHEELRAECRSAWHGQIGDIQMMREALERNFGIADYQPFIGRWPFHGSAGNPRGSHSGGEPR